MYGPLWTTVARIRLQITVRLRALPHPLNGVHHLGLLGQKRGAELLGPRHVARHHPEHRRKRQQRLDGRIPRQSIGGHGSRQRGVVQVVMLIGPASGIRNLLRERRGGEYLRQQRIGVERNWRHDALEFGRRIHRRRRHRRTWRRCLWPRERRTQRRRLRLRNRRAHERTGNEKHQTHGTRQSHLDFLQRRQASTSIANSRAAPAELQRQTDARATQTQAVKYTSATWTFLRSRKTGNFLPYPLCGARGTIVDS